MSVNIRGNTRFSGRDRIGTRNYYREVMSDNPVAYWRLGEPNGASIAIDEKGAYNGTYVGSPQGGVAGALADGNTAASFPGGTSHTTTPHVDTGSAMATVFTGNNPRSIECWFKSPPTVAAGAIIAKANNAAGAALMSWSIRTQADGKLVLALWNTSSTTSYWTVTTTNAVLTASTWAHIAVVVNDVNTRDALIYINGASVALTAGSAGTPPTAWSAAATNVWIGKEHFNATAFGIAGTIDEVAIYPSALSAARIIAHYRDSL